MLCSTLMKKSSSLYVIIVCLTNNTLLYAFIADCPGLTGLPNCGVCMEKADANSTAPCTACAAGYTLKDGLQSGSDAECVCKYFNGMMHSSL